MKALAIGLALAGLLALGLVVAAVSGAFDDDPPVRAASTARLKVDRFDGARAFAELRRQVEMGPRPAGSAASRRLAARIRRALPRGRYEKVPGGLRNVVGRLPGSKPAVVVAAHYDTKKLPGFVGANDGAGGTAAVLELARVLSRAKRPDGAPELRFVLFDGEEATNDKADFLLSGLRGSQGLRPPSSRRAAGARPARLRRQQGTPPPARGRLGSESCGGACAPRPGASALRPPSPPAPARRSSTITPRSPATASRRST